MEWFTVNEVLPEEITPLNYTLLPPGFRGDQQAIRVVQDKLKLVIDALGEESARAQRLSKVITSTTKLRNVPEHIIYLLKDPAGNGGAGEVIGLLKVGRKHLFLFDRQNAMRECEPLCLLDFYVTRERRGHGKKLFDYMLRDQGCSAEMLAVDGPSDKMQQFLHKNYGIDRLIRQNNNFAVAPQFFDIVGIMPPSQASPAPTPAVGRYTAHKPQCSVGNVIHGNGERYHLDAGAGAGASSGCARPPRAAAAHWR